MKEKIVFVISLISFIIIGLIFFFIYGESKSIPRQDVNVYKSGDKFEYILTIGESLNLSPANEIPKSITMNLVKEAVAESESEYELENKPEKESENESESLSQSEAVAESQPQYNTYTDGNLTINASIISDFSGDKYPVDLTIQKDAQNRYKISSAQDGQKFIPGNNKLFVEVKENESTKTITQNFSWGVLAINTNKATYKPKETARIDIAVLDEIGDMVCDADVELLIADPDNNITLLSSKGDDIKVSLGCKKKELILEADYSTEYVTGKTGTYNLSLTAITKNGTHTINDSFQVKDRLDYEVERITATRIYPALDYPVLIKVIANQDYVGKFAETVPSEFKIADLSKKEISDFYGIDINENQIQKYSQNQNELFWDVSWQKGQTYYYGYKYDAPNRSPDYYTLGPLKTSNYTEARIWQIAVDVIPTIRGFETSTQASNRNNFTMNMTAKRPAGDVYVAVICHDGTVAVEPPKDGGWTELADVREYAAYYKVGENVSLGSEAQSYTWTIDSGSEAWAGTIMRITGFDTSSPLNVTTTTNSSGSNSSPVAPAIIPTIQETLIIRSTGIDSDVFGSGWGPTGHTEVVAGNSGGSNDCSFAVATMDTPPDAYSSSGTATFGGGVSDTWGASTIAIQPNDSPGINYPFNGAELENLIPYLEFTGSDLNGTTDIIYQVEWDSDYDLSSSTIVSSDTDNGFENTVTPSDESPFIEGQKVRYTFDQALDNSGENEAYYWRVRSKIDGGSYGNWSSVYSFRINNSLKTDRWLQTADEQFEENVLIKTQTTGLGSVEVIGGVMPGIAFDSVSTNSNSSSHTSISVDHTVTGSETILFVICQGENQTVSSVTFGEDFLTNIPGASRSASGTMISTWYITGVTGTDTATCNMSNQDNSGIVAISYTGVSPFNPIGEVEVAGANDNNIVQSFDTSYDDSMILEIITGDGGDTDPFTPQSGQTERWDFASGTSTGSDTGYAGYELSAPTAGNYNLNVDMNVTDDYSYAAIEIRPYDPNIGNVLSQNVDFDYIQGMTSWKDFSWTWDEGVGEEVLVSLYYTVSSTCDTIVPNSDLSGNESGFTNGNVDISDLNTTTYNEICLYATLEDDAILLDWNIRWSKSINVTGTFYLSDKITPATTGNGGQCNSSTQNLTARSNGNDPVSASCSSVDGTFTLTGVEAEEGDSITIYSSGADKANRVILSDGNDLSGQNLYKNAVAVLDVNDGELNISEMIYYDNDQNATDMLFDAEDSGTDTLTWESGVNLYVPESQVFTPQGNTNGHDIQIVGTWKASPDETINLDGSFDLTFNGTFVPSTSSLIFDATSGTEYIYTLGTGNIYNLIVNDGGGSLNLINADTLRVENDLSILNGTLDVLFSNSGSATYTGSGSFEVPNGVTSITVKAWGAGGGGGAGGTSGVGGSGGGGGFAQATLSVTGGETLDIIVGTGGGEGTYPSTSGGGGGGGGRSAIERSGTPLVIAAGGAGGGGGDNSSSTAGGAGGPGGGTTGLSGSASGSAGGGSGGTNSTGGSGGTGGGNAGADGASETGGLGANGGSNSSAGDGGASNGGSPNGGNGGTGNTGGYAGGGGGGDGYYGGGGGSGSVPSDAGGGGGGGGSSYFTGTGTSTQSGSGVNPGNTGDTNYESGRGVGGDGGAVTTNGNSGTGGMVYISYTGSSLAQDIYVGGDWTNDDTFLERTGTVFFDGDNDSNLDSGCSNVSTCTSENFNNIRVQKGPQKQITLINNPLRITGTLYVDSGVFNQGNYNLRSEGTTAIDIADEADYTSIQQGDLTLGGNVLNDGSININANGLTCGDNDDIVISSTNTTPRTWSGTGYFNIADASISYQTGIPVIKVGSGTNSGNNINFLFITCGITEVEGLNIEGIEVD